MASSAAIYGVLETLPLAESATTEPTSPYGIDKLTGDHYTRRYHDLYGLDTVALRYFNIYGPRQTTSSYAGVISIFLLSDERPEYHCRRRWNADSRFPPH